MVMGQVSAPMTRQIVNPGMDRRWIRGLYGVHLATGRESSLSWSAGGRPAPRGGRQQLGMRSPCCSALDV